MPYIPKDYRPGIDHLIHLLFDQIHDVEGKVDYGRINYAVTRLLLLVFKQSQKYDTANSIMGVLEGIKLEYYRKAVAPYEEQKILDNGEVHV